MSFWWIVEFEIRVENDEHTFFTNCSRRRKLILFIACASVCSLNQEIEGNLMILQASSVEEERVSNCHI